MAAPGPFQQMLMGAGFGGTPWAMGGAVGMGLIKHALGARERRRQRRLQTAMARWTPYNQSLAGGLTAALQPRPNAFSATELAATGQKLYDERMDRLAQRTRQDQQVAQRNAGFGYSPDLPYSPMGTGVDPGFAARGNRYLTGAL